MNSHDRVGDASATKPAIDRRLFLLGLAATAACGDSGSDGVSAESTTTAAPTTTTTTVPPTTAQAPTTLAPAPTTTTEPPLPDTEVELALIDADIAATSVHFVEAAATYVVAVPEDLREPFKASLDPSLHAGVDAGYLALFNKCTHLGCKVAPCDAAIKLDPLPAEGDAAVESASGDAANADAVAEGEAEGEAGAVDGGEAAEPSGELVRQFWCPCHASAFSLLGEYRGGPAMSALYNMPIEVGETSVTIRASAPVDGLGRDIDISGLPAGEAC